MEQTDRELLQKTYEIERENNKMLKAMRRSAFLGGIVRVLWWLVILGVPLWAYVTYLQPIVNDMLNTAKQVQGTTVQAQMQIQQLQETLKKIPGYSLLGGQ